MRSVDVSSTSLTREESPGPSRALETEVSLSSAMTGVTNTSRSNPFRRLLLYVRSKLSGSNGEHSNTTSSPQASTSSEPAAAAYVTAAMASSKKTENTSKLQSQGASASGLAATSTTSTSNNPLKSILKTHVHVEGANSDASAPPADLLPIQEKIIRVEALMNNRKSWFDHRNAHLNLYPMSRGSSSEKREHTKQITRANNELKKCNYELHDAINRVLASNVQSQEAKTLIFEMLGKLKHAICEILDFCCDGSEEDYYVDEYERVRILWKRMHHAKVRSAKNEWLQIPVPLDGSREIKVQIHTEDNPYIFTYMPEN